MKKLLMVLAVALGTIVMVNAQTTPVQAKPAKEVKATKTTTKKDAKKVVKKEEAGKTTMSTEGTTSKKG